LLREAYQAAASLRLAVVLIALLAVVLAWATFVESRYDTPAVHFGIYDTWWFITICGLLAINVLSAALIRWPWKRHQTGFVVIHGGILVLLAGCVFGVLGGVDSKLPVVEGNAAYRAYKDSQHFELQVTPLDAAADDAEAGTKAIWVPFRGGPFNWDDYQNKFWFPWRLAHRSRGVIYNRQGITLEVLDYCSDSRRMPFARTSLPRLTVAVSSPADMAAGREAEPERDIKLAVSTRQGPHASLRPFGVGDAQPTPQGPRLLFWDTDSKAETEAFLHSRPQGPLGRLGQVVLYLDGQTFRFAVDRLRQGLRQPLGDTGLEVELIRTNISVMGNSLPWVELEIYCPDEPPQTMKLYAYSPHMNRQDELHRVFGTYWLDETDTAADRGDKEGTDTEKDRKDPRSLRIDILQGHDQQLYLRTWSPPHVETIAPWPTRQDSETGLVGSEIVAFAGSETPLTLRLKEFSPGEKPAWKIRPMPFEKEDDRRAWPQRRVRVRLTVDDTTEVFWLAAETFGNPQVDRQYTVEGENRRVSVTLPSDRVELGCAVYLHEFRHDLVPGSSVPANFSSLVDLVDRDSGEKFREEALVTLNAPVDFTDPQTGRAFRLAQKSYWPPFRPGTPQFRQYAHSDTTRDQLSLSWLEANHDPGRGLKYTGSLLIVAGVVILYYMRAYFFRKRNPGVGAAVQPPQPI
jgi:hypothetical protein